MQIKLKTACLALPLLFAPLAHANLQIYPSKGIFGLDQECRTNLTEVRANSPAIVCDFSKAVDNPTTRAEIQNIFEQELNNGFGSQIVGQIEQKTKNRTYVASLEVLRASEYIVNKESTTEILLPVTLSLKLTNILTGEVIYSDSATLSQPIKVLTTEVNTAATKAQVEQQFRSSILKLTQQITRDLKQKLKLSEIQTSVVDEWKSYLILDKGYSQGISKNDELSSAEGGLIRVVHSDSDYAVAVPVLPGNQSKNFVKTASNTRQAVNKPRALIVDVLTFRGESKDLIEQIFADAVGENAAFSLTPVNKRYSSLAQSISEETRLAQAQDIQQRELPEFFIRINVMPTIGYEQQIGKITQQQIVRSEVMAEMIDQSGRVIFSHVAKDEIKEVISQGMGLSLEDRREIALKNALIKLGEEFKNGIKFTRTDLKVNKVTGQNISIDDTGERLNLGMKVHVYNAQKAAGKQILIPTWEATVIDHQNGKAVAQLDFPISGASKVPVHSNDIVLINSSNASVGNSKKAWAFCPSLQTEQIGEIAFPAFGALTYSALVQHAKRPFYATGSGLKDQLALKDAVQLITQNAGFKKDLNMQFHLPTEECLQPVFKIQIKEGSVACNSDKSDCDATLVMTSGVRTFNAKQERTGAHGLQQEIQLKNIDPRHRYEMYNIQMLDALPPILKQIVQKADSSQ